mmetsp:Transcript_433/g.565  ORF Transcript_433/g.565 Transcript_433/m.565 type:complete len:515 (+) Transcript_433:388-1932(+)|eukprot:CAMPEP_0203751794 /NCGR_PEP_ID=MMETSP0098-20131031/5809_1 /ASSEMBLY_ACC=CAM_ASM_000208 /TAXON_ID=96639 /ORGANISM=" , Strain NY0313808BC1" /LENGTH=514 /DNA_ID=CAMNT_0050641685 /DNA_START=322 /DNA_END=1866 /DNA_ORIENTATION=+
MERGESTNVCKVDTLEKTGRRNLYIASFVGFIVAVLFAVLGPVSLFDLSPKDGSGENIDLKKVGWGHSFVFVNLYSNHFRLSMKPKANASMMTSRHLSKDIMVHIEWAGVDHHDSVQVFSNKTVPRKVDCFNVDGVVECNDVLLFLDSYITFKRYYFTIKIPDEYKYQIDFIENVDFMFTYENLKFAIWEIRVNYFAYGLSVLASLYWFYVCKMASVRYDAMNHRLEEDTVSSSKFRCFRRICCCFNRSVCPYRTSEQRWMIALLIALMCYNQPLYGFQYLNDEGWKMFFVNLSVFMQFGFVCMLMLFWLISFETLYRPPPYGKWFYIPKILFTTVFWIIGVSLYANIVSKKHSDRLYDWYDDSTITQPIVIVLSVFGGFYFFWMLFIGLKASGHLFSLDPGQKLVFFGHVWRIILISVGIAAGAVFGEDIRYSRFTFFYQFLFNFYLMELVYIFQPVTKTTAALRDEGLGAVSDEVGVQDIEISSVAPRSFADFSDTTKPTKPINTNVELSEL